jgi:uncharacterized protein YjbJ (UPF0337 family)
VPRTFGTLCAIGKPLDIGAKSPRKRGHFFMNKEQFKGSWQQFRGEVKKKWGQLTDNDLLEAEADYIKFLGIVQKRYGERKEEVNRWAEEWYELHASDFNKEVESRSKNRT